ncbi:MAG: SLBB domain-containing protein [Verrucomicrobia bacterium]|nr:SLBB domain-containing protein [Verrucomicrobiota bacterium]
MKYFRCLFSVPSTLLSALLALALLGGCASSSNDSGDSSTDTGTVSAADTQSADYLRPGDRIKIVYNDIPDVPTPTEQVVPEDGRILLPRGVEVVVIGKKRTDVEREIASIYVDEKRIYRKITVTIERMASFISVGGEVRMPSSVVYRGDMTVTAAIAAAGGFTEYANRSRVVVTRAANKKQINVNVRKAVSDPKLDLLLYPGDQVHVPRSIL